MNNETFNGIDNNDKIYCFDLKYWLYDQIKKENIKGLSVNNLFEEQHSIKDKIVGIRSAPCAFRELNQHEYNKLKSIYAFILLYYNNIKAIHEKKLYPANSLTFLEKE